MELKFEILRIGKPLTEVLIIPYGIEIDTVTVQVWAGITF